MSWPSEGGAGGPASPDLTTGNTSGITYLGSTIRANTSSGKYVLEQFVLGAWKPVQTADVNGTEIATTLKTGPNSLVFGVHAWSSTGENATCRNTHTGVQWSPLWQGVSADGLTVYDPSARQFTSSRATLTPAGAIVHATTSVPHITDVVLTDNFEFVDVTLHPAQAYSGDLFFTATYDNAAGAVIGAQRIAAATLIADVPYKIVFENSLYGRTGQTIHTELRTATGASVMVRSSTANLTKPYRSDTVRPFIDTLVPTIDTRPLTVTVAGDTFNSPPITAVARKSYNFRGVTYAPPGKWVESMVLAGPNLRNCTSVSFDDLVGIVGQASILANFAGSKVTSLSFPKLVYGPASGFTVSIAAPLASVDLSALQLSDGTINITAPPQNVTMNALLYANFLDVSTCTSSANTVTMNNAIALGGFKFNGTLVAPSLTHINGQLTCDVAANIPSLAAIQYIHSISLLTNLPTSFTPAWTEIGGAIGGSSTSITSVDLTAVQRIGMYGNASVVSVQITMPNLAAFSMPNIKAIGGNFQVSGGKLPQANIDAILARLVALDGTAGTTLYTGAKTVNLTGGTNATPSAAGLASKATLAARGITVTHN
jgi:hypothetical protein